jgi:hypothetical protein
MDKRGQAYTIEGIIGAIVVASALVLGLQAVDIAPWADDSASEQTEALRVQVQDVLEAADDRDALRTAATCIDGDGNGKPHPAVAAGGRANDSERDQLGILLNRSLDANGHQYNVFIEYQNNSNRADVNRTDVLVSSRSPGRSSVTVTRQVPLFDSDPTLAFDSDQGACVPTRTISNPDSATLGARDDDADNGIYIQDQHESSELYAVIKIRVEAW